MRSVKLELLSKPEARQMTANEVEQVELAAWCGGQIKGMRLDPDDRSIEIRNDGIEETANVDQWIVKLAHNYHIILDGPALHGIFRVGV